MNTLEAALVVGVTQRSLRRFVQGGQLIATLSPRGYVLDPEVVREFAKSRGEGPWTWRAELGNRPDSEGHAMSGYPDPRDQLVTEMEALKIRVEEIEARKAGVEAVEALKVLLEAVVERTADLEAGGSYT